MSDTPAGYDAAQRGVPGGFAADPDVMTPGLRHLLRLKFKVTGHRMNNDIERCFHSISDPNLLRSFERGHSIRL